MIVDLCSGLGRWESAKQDVISIDLDPKTKPTIVADIRYLPLKQGLKPNYVHASPPCKYFSFARAPEGINYEGIAESLRLVASCFDAFDYLEAENWTLENPIGWLYKLFNQTMIVYSAYDLDKKRTYFYSNNRSLARSIIPQDVRNRILELIEN